jgi:hypothetical protein
MCSGSSSSARTPEKQDVVVRQQRPKGNVEKRCLCMFGSYGALALSTSGQTGCEMEEAQVVATGIG